VKPSDAIPSAIRDASGPVKFDRRQPVPVIGVVAPDAVPHEAHDRIAEKLDTLKRLLGPDEVTPDEHRIPACVRRKTPTAIPIVRDLPARLTRAMAPILAAVFGVDVGEIGCCTAYDLRDGSGRVRLGVDVALSEERVEAVEAFVRTLKEKP
jgi:hypothetical protein